ncbi:transcription factor E2F4-like [Betta splendens]|uniref:Transcription factor E2F4-like n=1 Tax=Betta splendens TaxID=158456 RepID=A0A6P7M2Y6_BETSP|nr:transcription factor E2F4-like [Betta splendens]XP_029000465.1 transcription factor E2F4-like [Betta splendens]
MDHDFSPDEEIDISDPNPKNQRTQRSLTVLTTKFMELIQEAKDGELDLKDAIHILTSGQRRRIYDITNVLEGIGLIVKIDKRIIKWVGDVSYKLTKRLRELMSELEDLEQKEFMLDQHKHSVEQSIRDITEDCSNLTYVNHDDICNCFSGNTLLAIRPPSGTQLDVPIPKAVQDGPVKYQIYLKSSSGPIDVVLLNKGSVNSVPLVLPVPPPEEMLQSAMLAMSASNDTQSRNTHLQASPDTTKMPTEDMHPLQSRPFLKTEPDSAAASKWPDFSKELRNLLDSPNEIMNANIITKLVASQVLSPLLHLSPPPSDHKPIYNLDDSETLCDLYDVSVLNA